MGEALTLDLEGALERVDGDRELLMELVEIFFDVFQEQLEQLAKAAETQNSEELFSVAHSIKGAAGNVGAMAASFCAREIERLGHEGEVAAVQEWVDKLGQEVGQFRSACLDQGLMPE